MTEVFRDLSTAERVDGVCDQFEQEFRAGRAPRIEDFLTSASESLSPILFQALLELEIELRQRSGEACDRTNYESRFPTYLSQIRHVFEGIGQAPSVNVASVETSQLSPVPSGISLRNAPMPTQLGRFEILSVLGEGEFGTVFRARDPQLDRDVAIKVPKFAGQQSHEDRERFLREARAAAGLHHANICPVHEIGSVDGRDYIVLAYIDGKPLSRLLQSQRQLTDRQIVAVVRKLALALQEAHSHGIIHRDLKPANIMMTRKGEPVIMDFGLARRSFSEDSQISHSGQILGTPAYMSPEQARGDKAVGPAADLYSLGVVLFELLCGHRPFDGTVTEVIGKILHQDPPPLAQFRSDVNPRLEALCLKAIRKSPAERFGSMNEFAAALLDTVKSLPSQDATIATGEPVRDQPESVENTLQATDVPGRAIAKRARRAFQWALLAALSTSILLGIVFLVRKETVAVTVEIPLENPRDPALSFLLDDQPVLATAFDAPVELRPGRHDLVVRRDGLIVKRFLLQVGAKKHEPVVIRDLTPAVAGPEERSTEAVPEERKPEPAQAAVEEDRWIELFNGRDLEGWTQVGPAAWTVREGGVFAEPTRPGHLVYQSPIEEFELTCEVFAAPRGNGGVCFRVDKTPANGALQIGGYEFQVAGSQGDPGRNYTGGLYAGGQQVSSVNPPIVEDRTWTPIRIRLDKQRLQGWVGDRRMFDIQTSARRMNGQKLTLQSYAQGGQIGYRNLRLRPLGATLPTPAPADAAPLGNQPMNSATP